MTVDAVTAALDALAASWDTDHGSLLPHCATSYEDAVAGVQFGDPVLRLATGGWSENEHTLSKWRKANPIAWGMTWRLSACGGLHIFRYPK